MQRQFQNLYQRVRSESVGQHHSFSVSIVLIVIFLQGSRAFQPHPPALHWYWTPETDKKIIKTAHSTLNCPFQFPSFWFTMYRNMKMVQISFLQYNVNEKVIFVHPYHNLLKFMLYFKILTLYQLLRRLSTTS